MLASPPEEKVDMQEFETGGGGYLLRNCIATPSQMQLANIAKAIVGNIKMINWDFSFCNNVTICFHGWKRFLCRYITRILFGPPVCKYKHRPTCLSKKCKAIESSWNEMSFHWKLWNCDRSAAAECGGGLRISSRSKAGWKSQSSHKTDPLLVLYTRSNPPAQSWSTRTIMLVVMSTQFFPSHLLPCM